MKKWLFSLLVCLVCSSCDDTRKSYIIRGTIQGAPEAAGTVYLKAFRNKMFFDYDSAEIKNGKFVFHGSVDEPLLFGVQTEDMRSPVQFFVENREMKLLLIPEERNVRILNSPQNDIFLSNAPVIQNEGYNIDSLITRYPDSPAAAFYLYRYFTYQLPLDELKTIRAKMSPSLNSSPYVIDLDDIIARLETMELGNPAPDFTLPDTGGNPVSLADFRGQYVLLEFWAGWCPHCRVENPNLVEAYEAYKDKNFTILGISLDFKRDQWTGAIEKDKLPWIHVSDLKYWDSEIPALYGIRAIPANVLVDPQGIMIARDIKGDKLWETLKENLE